MTPVYIRRILKSLNRLCCLLIILTLSVLSCSGDSYIGEAVTALGQSNYEEAERVLEHILYSDPENSEALILACRVAIARKKWTTAYSFYDSLRSSLGRHDLRILGLLCKEYILSGIASNNPELRKYAYAELSSLEDESNIHFFYEGLSDSSLCIQIECIKTLTEMKEIQAFSSIQKLISAENSTVRYLSAASLFCFGEYLHAAPVLIQAFKFARVSIQREILQMLSRVRNPELIPILRGATESGYVEVKLQACKHLLQMGQDELAYTVLDKTGDNWVLNNNEVIEDVCCILNQSSEQTESLRMYDNVFRDFNTYSLEKKLLIYRCMAQYSKHIPDFNPESYLRHERSDIRLLAVEIIYYQNPARGRKALEELYYENIKNINFIVNTGDTALLALTKIRLRDEDFNNIRKIGLALACERDISGIDVLLPYCISIEETIGIMAAGSIIEIIRMYTGFPAA